MKKTKVGIIGCGNISGIYFEAGKKFKNLEISACADLNRAAAEAQGKKYKARVLGVEELLKDKGVEIVLNLTIPAAHAAISKKALAAGKHVYSEKPLGVTLAEGKALMSLAKARRLRVGCAPDTFLGAGLQTCRKLIDDGAIGRPVAATAFMLSHGMEMWHPNPHSFYQPGAGPMFDMGPYYITALVHLLGPVSRIAGVTKTSFPERIVTAEGPTKGQKVKVNTPTHVSGLMEFKSGPVATIVTSFDVWSHKHSPIEIYGTEGSLAVPDPNSFGNEVFLRKAGAPEWKSVRHTHGYADNSRGLGLSDMASAIASGRPHRASGQLALHVLECMQSFLDSHKAGKHLAMTTSVERPAALPLGLKPGKVD